MLFPLLLSCAAARIAAGLKECKDAFTLALEEITAKKCVPEGLPDSLVKHHENLKMWTDRAAAKLREEKRAAAPQKLKKS